MVTLRAPGVAQPPRALRRWAGIGKEVVLVSGALTLYQVAQIRSTDARPAAMAHARQLLAFERALGIDIEQAVQRVALRSDGIRRTANTFYTWSYWPMLLGSAVLLWNRDRPRYHQLRDGMVISGVAGLLVFLRYPVAPPRMLPGYVDTIEPGTLAHTIVHGSMTDPYAALPSFHVGWFNLAAVVVASSVPSRAARPIAFGAAGAMAASVVITANHYVVDVLGGIALSFVGASAARHLRRLATGRSGVRTSGAG